ncbi:hypothetical protein E1B28_006553 [Marasmius oreades]|uniref:Uncharacterized protein n=1 Tax=Marasmius oreades TaxID=181124 RepID=A0A9P7S5J8_9AGAR|nr:uncharacterized protein E1B28_006553 [Marasmius oreades]KAG7095861.1 hypothetical protein E1B28_006553 [Marasmius oreades]
MLWTTTWLRIRILTGPSKLRENAKREIILLLRIHRKARKFEVRKGENRYGCCRARWKPSWPPLLRMEISTPSRTVTKWRRSDTSAAVTLISATAGQHVLQSINSSFSSPACKFGALLPRNSRALCQIYEPR